MAQRPQSVLLARMRGRLNALALRVDEPMRRRWLGYRAHGTAEREDFIAAAQDLVPGATDAGAALAATYLALLAELQGRTLTVELSGIAAAVVAERWLQPFNLFWMLVTEGRDLDEARASGAAMVTRLARTDVWQPWHDAPQRVSADQVPRWRWVTESGACDACRANDGLVYEAGHRPRIHPSCGCGQEPVWG